MMKRGLVEDSLEVYGNCADNLSNNLRLNEIPINIFFLFYCKIDRNQLEIVGEAIIWDTPILILWNITSKILRKKLGDEAFRVSFKFSRHGCDQRLADFNRFSTTETHVTPV